MMDVAAAYINGSLFALSGILANHFRVGREQSGCTGVALD